MMILLIEFGVVFFSFFVNEYGNVGLDCFWMKFSLGGVGGGGEKGKSGFCDF